MGKKLDNLRRVVQKLESRYGKDDVDVQRMRADLNVLEAIKEAKIVERRAATPHKHNFQSLAKQHFHASKQADLH